MFHHLQSFLINLIWATFKLWRSTFSARNDLILNATMLIFFGVNAQPSQPTIFTGVNAQPYQHLNECYPQTFTVALQWVTALPSIATGCYSFLSPLASFNVVCSVLFQLLMVWSSPLPSYSFQPQRCWFIFSPDLHMLFSAIAACCSCPFGLCA